MTLLNISSSSVNILDLNTHVILINYHTNNADELTLIFLNPLKMYTANKQILLKYFKKICGGINNHNNMKILLISIPKNNIYYSDCVGINNVSIVENFTIHLNYKNLSKNISELNLKNVAISFKNKYVLTNLPNTLKIFNLQVLSIHDHLTEDKIINLFLKYSPQSLVEFNLTHKFCCEDNNVSTEMYYKTSNIFKKIYKMYSDTNIKNIRKMKKDDYSIIFNKKNIDYNHMRYLELDEICD